ncbi:MAG TPA: ABC transporter ATP-binding protein [Myxococcota bacterium]|nr:ABC transporter ATP-binding protein [Myxococcota bacterium]
MASGLRKRFGARVAVDGVSLRVAPGEIYGLLGPNGAGKTTTILLVCGVLPRDEGYVLVDGRDLDSGPAARARIGLAPQWLGLYPDLTGRENLEFWGRMYGLDGPALASAVEAALFSVGLVDRARDLVATYSGGMMRRLNLASALLHRPPLLVLDEPTVGVDPQSRNAIFEHVAKLRAEGTAILYTTHYMEEAERLCDRIGIIDGGRLQAEGTRRELLASLGEGACVEVTLGGSDDAVRAAAVAASLAGVASAAPLGSGIRVVAKDATAVLPPLLEVLLGAGLRPNRIELREPDLEAVFLRLTGRALRD